MYSLSNAVKKRCPYKEKCYRKNPIHFNEMSHPHLENIVKDQLEGQIDVPDDLDFECPDRSLLMDQLKILQMVLKKERNNVGSTLLTLNKTENTKASYTSSVSTNKCDNSGTESGSSLAKDKHTKVANVACKPDQTISEALKDRVERHKQITLQRREDKLKEMDAQAAAMLKAFTSTNDESCNKQIDTMRKELGNLESEEKEPTGHNDRQEKKKKSDNSSSSSCPNKKSRSDKNSQDNVKECSGSSMSSGSSSSGKDSSMMDLYQTCTSGKSRDDVRQKAIQMLKRQGFEVSLVEPGNFALKYALSAPYHLFFTRVQKSKETYGQQYSITFPEILDKSLGEIVSSLQINFMVDAGWLCLQYLLAGQRTDMLILYGERVDTEKLNLNITMVHVETPSRFGCHHSKVMILKYKDDALRIVVSTANLYSDDWENRTQGLWISPHLPQLPESANPGEGESPTGFKKDFLRYLAKYKQLALSEWTWAIRRADFSDVNVCFVASVPGSHKQMEFDSWGHKKLGATLSKHASLPPDAPQWPIVAQSSSIGSLGPNYESWLLKDIVPSMSREIAKGLKSHPNFQFVYPSLNNYKESFDCRAGSCCLPYTLQTHSKQEWIQSYLYQWKASRTARDRAMPHIKSYTRFSPDFKRIAWFVLTSANLSKAAWGTAVHSNYIMSYEAGVIFIPKLITGTTTFPIEEEESGAPVFPIPYDIPLTRYEQGDKPFVMEFFDG